MAYTKNTWRTGDVVSSQKLNHMEDGIANSTLVISGFSYAENSSDLVGTSDKTWQEIDDALSTGVRCVIIVAGMGGHDQLPVNSVVFVNGVYRIFFNDTSATTTSADGYPTIS